MTPSGGAPLDFASISSMVRAKPRAWILATRSRVSCHAALGLPLDDLRQGRARPVDERQEEMEFAPAVERRQLDAGDDLDAGPATLVDGVRVGGHGVVVGDRNGAHAVIPGETDQVGRRMVPVAALVRVDVEIDPSAHARSSRPVRTL